MNLLNSIAQPYVADMAGSVLGGMQAGQAMSPQGQDPLARVAAELDVQQKRQNLEKGSMELGQAQQQSAQELITQSVYDSIAAYSMGGEQRVKFLKTLLPKYQSNPELYAGLQDLIKLPESEQDAKILEGMEIAARVGIIPKTEEVLKPTSLQQDLMAAGLMPGTPEFRDAMLQAHLRPSSQVTVNNDMGRIPEGFRFADNGNLVPIPGGPAAVARQEQVEKLVASSAIARQQASNVLSTITDASLNVDTFTVGIPGSLVGLVPGTRAYALNQQLDTIKASLGFDKLGEMRAISPTGGALGQVSERELAQLERAVVSLDRKQDSKTLQKNLAKVSKHYNNWLQTTLESNKRKSQLLQADPNIFSMPEEAVIGHGPQRVRVPVYPNDIELPDTLPTPGQAPPVAAPPVAAPPVAAPPVATSPVAAPPVATSPVAAPPGPQVPGVSLAPAGAINQVPLDTVIMTHPQFGVVTEADVQETMKGPPPLTREQVLQRLQQIPGAVLGSPGGR